MRLLRAMAPAWILLAALAAFTLWARARLPDAPMAVHFDGQFRPNGWWPRDRALFVPLGIEAAVLAVLAAAPWLLPPKGALERSAPAYGAACFALSAFLGAVQFSILSRALGWPTPPIGMVLPVGVGLLLLVLGNYLGKIRYNFVMGVRTPWTLASEAVWDRTHRVAAPLFMLGGAGIVAGAIFAPGHAQAIILAGALVPGLLASAYSWWLWAHLPDEDRRRIGSR